MSERANICLLFEVSTHTHTHTHTLALNYDGYKIEFTSKKINRMIAAGNVVKNDSNKLT